MYEIAVLTRLIELGKRYGLEPWEYNFDYHQDTCDVYVTGGCGHAFDEMILALGVPENSAKVPHQDGADLLMRLDEAIRNAPRRWSR